MKEIYLKLRQRARAIVAGLPKPEFYTKFSEEITASENIFASTSVLVEIKKKIIPMLENDFGHGVLHSVLVCRDAGAIVMIEMQNHLIDREVKSDFKKKSVLKTKLDAKVKADITRKMVLVQIAGLLHDIKRKYTNHALKGAEFAKKFLEKGYLLSSREIDLICNAIRKHEAFQQKTDTENNQALYNIDDGSDQSLNKNTAFLLSGALYDADKFRWGPDNFTHTVWDMVIFSDTPFEEFKERYPLGMEKLAEIRNTFRTDTGKKYGPEFIDLGIKTGEILAEFIQSIST